MLQLSECHLLSEKHKIIIFSNNFDIAKLKQLVVLIDCWLAEIMAFFVQKEESYLNSKSNQIAELECDLLTPQTAESRNADLTTIPHWIIDVSGVIIHLHPLCH